MGGRSEEATVRLGFCGPSGSGKSTLARYVAERYHLDECPVGSRSVAKSMGFLLPYDVDVAGKRAEFQREFLRQKRAWEQEHSDFVTDRTTLDNLAYATLHAVDSIDEAFLAAAVEGMRRYTHVVYCPALAFLDVAGDPARKSDPTYHRLFDAVLEGFLIRWSSAMTLTLWEGDLDARKRKIDALF